MLKRRLFLLILFLSPLIALLAFLGYFNRRQTIVGDELKSFASLTDPRMSEVSGLVESQRFPKVLWAHNDSGNEPRLFAVDVSGKLVLPRGVAEEEYQGIEVQGAELVDWEDITRYGDKLYISEMGNNLNARRHLGLYELSEPDPATDRSIKVDRFIEVRYPDQKNFPPRGPWHFDCEAAFCKGDSLYFVTKNRPPYRLFVQQDSAGLYRLPLAEMKDKNVLEKVDSVTALGGWVTAADATADGKWVAILCESPVQSIWLYECPPEGHELFSKALSIRRYVFHHGGQLESLAFAPDGEEQALYMINEEKEMFKIGMDKFQPWKRD